jgi:very-short-patch-repair endonuclease
MKSVKEKREKRVIDSPETLQEKARWLRKNQTPAEKMLWQHLRNRKLNGHKFRRQHPLQQGFVLDFYCLEARIAIEVDGGYHTTGEQKEYDVGRTFEVNEYGISVIRFRNEDVLNNMEEVLKAIEWACSTPSSTTGPAAPFPHPPAPSPENGEGEE